MLDSTELCNLNPAKYKSRIRNFLIIISGGMVMAAITAAMVKELREMTGSGMMDCKKALGAVEGDMEKAVEWLRENGFMKAAKKAERIAAEGVCAVSVSEDGKNAAIVEVNSETDFVAKNEKFTTFAADVAKKALATTKEKIEDFLEEEYEAGKSIKTALTEKIAVIGENLKIRRFSKLSEVDGFVESYIHGSRIGVLVSFKTDVVNENITEMAKNVAMQIAAMRPIYLNREEVPSDYLEHEMEILKVQAANDDVLSKKPANVLENILKGQLSKQLKEICLVDQVYVKDGSLTVQGYIDSVAKENNAKITISGFVRFETGEGIEKKNEDFAAEVAAQIKG